MRVRLITTGGTFDKVYFDAKGGYAIGDPQAHRILDDARSTLQLDVVELLRKDSLDMNDADRAAVRDAVIGFDGAGVVVVHGTDTMVDTAAALGDVGARTVVFTGAMVPARFRVTDADFNLGLAFGAVQTAPPGVYLAINGRVFDARRVRKNAARGVFEPTDG